ncbi:TspO/MBR family protein [Kitasatospora sp. NBC_00315]|uniref:TspO/MBR family protein n=1 Tax=Kitasatospora sp. NBC_00315 TaxID=2975963 RepID=UPI00352F719E
MTATAIIGGRAVDADSAWYRSLAKPPWQPPGWAFGAVWTPLYASIAWAGGRALLKTHGQERRALTASLGVNLTLNTAWNWLFFHGRSPTAGAAGTLVLDLSNTDLIRRTAHADRTAATALIPYAAWSAFATALNIDIARRDRTNRR